MRAFYSSPIGFLIIDADNSGIFSIQFSKNKTFNKSVNSYPLFNQHLRSCFHQLDEYFNGRRRDFSLKLLLKGTDFQKIVWKSVMRIPFGETVSYKYIAEEIVELYST